MSKKTAPSPSPSAATAAVGPAVRVAALAQGSKPGALMVELADGGKPVPARSLVSLDDEAVRQAVLSRQAVVVLFENEDRARPIVAGLLPPDPGAALLGSLLKAPDAAAAATATTARRLEARLDGKRVVLEGEHEVVLRCGEASITLRRDGKVFLRGAYIETTASGLNRIRGGSVKIN